MDIMLKQTIEYKNVLSYKFSASESEISIHTSKIEDILCKYGLKKNGDLFSTTYSMSMIEGKKIMDMELLVPVDNITIIEEKDFVIKKEFLLTNAIKMRVVGANMLQNSLNSLNDYMIKNQLIAITPMYTFVKNDGILQNAVDVTIEVYVGISPNKL